VDAFVHLTNPQEIYEAITKEFFPKTSTSLPEPKAGRLINMGISPKRLQLLYQEHPRRAMRHILPDAQPAVFPSTESLTSHFTKPRPTFSYSPDPSLFTPFEFSICSPFSPEEILSYLKSRPNSSPGHEGITYSQWRNVHPAVLCHLFDAILDARAIPDNWRGYRTVLIPKPGKDDYADVNAWRPIALLPTTYKIFTGILTRRLMTWTQKHLSPAQKALLHSEGTIEHAFTIQTVVDDSDRFQRPLCMVWLDLADAFGSVPHDALFDHLHFLGLDLESVNLLRLLYSDYSSYYTAGSTVTKAILGARGVRQGCPLSMSLFCLFIEILIRAVTPLLDGYQTSGGVSIKCLAYADDLCLVSSDPAVLQAALNKIGSIANTIGMSFRPSKCHSLLFCCQTLSPLTINGGRIGLSSDTSGVRYLGVPCGLRVKQSPEGLFNDIVSDLDKIVNSSLLPAQKLDAYKTFLLSRLFFHFRTRNIDRVLISSAFNRNGGRPDGHGLNELVIQRVRAILNLPSSSSTHYLHTSIPLGGCGVPNLTQEYAALTLVQAFRLLNSNDPAVRNLAFNDLRRSVSSRFPKDHTVTEEDMTKYLNTDPTDTASQKTVFSPWCRFRWAVQKLQILNVSFHIPKGCSQVSLSFLVNNIDTPTKFGPGANKIITKMLHRSLAAYHQLSLSRLRMAGQVPLVAAESKFSSRFLFSEHVNTFDWKFAHKARLQILPTLSHMSRWGNNNYTATCRRCADGDETQLHIFNLCPANMSLVTKRHNELLGHLVDFAKRLLDQRWEFFVDTQYPGSGSTERVDLILKHPQRKVIEMVDIKSPFENRDCFERVRSANETKYSSLRNTIAAMHPDYSVRLSTFSVASLGSWDPCNEPLLQRLGFAWRDIKTIARTCTLSALSSSRKIWNAHTDGFQAERAR
jgi:hypothetical protein